MSDLGAIIRGLSQPLEPQPTGLEPMLPKLEGIRAVVFDVYGTLLISGSGDISLTSGASRGEAAAEALRAVSGDSPALADGVDGDRIVEHLHEAIRESHAESPVDYPEVEIREIWASVLDRIEFSLADSTIESLAVDYECRVNPVWPMPGAAETLTQLSGAGRTLGIVSNAQFFTPIAMEELLGATLADLGFNDLLGVWSFAHRQAKPGRFLYEQSAAALAEQGIAPSEVLYLGNDMLNDVMPAAAVGFRTALFAGDARSLRMRGDDPRVAGVRPDAVLTDLRQVLSILSLAAD